MKPELQDVKSLRERTGAGTAACRDALSVVSLTSLYEKRVFAYRNLRRKCWSIRLRGRVVGHANRVVLRDCELRVSEAGRQRVLRDRQKNVHAGVWGILCWAEEGEPKLGEGRVQINKAAIVRATYDPYTMPSFRLLDGTPIHRTKVAYFSSGLFVAIPVDKSVPTG